LLNQGCGEGGRTAYRTPARYVFFLFFLCISPRRFTTKPRVNPSPTARQRVNPVPSVCGGGGGCAGGGVLLGAVLALSWCGKVSVRGILIIIGARTLLPAASAHKQLSLQFLEFWLFSFRFISVSSYYCITSPFWSATQIGATYGGLFGMPACEQAMGCVVCDTPELWCGAAGLCARVRACAGATESLHTYIRLTAPSCVLCLCSLCIVLLYAVCQVYTYTI